MATRKAAKKKAAGRRASKKRAAKPAPRGEEARDEEASGTSRRQTRPQDGAETRREEASGPPGGEAPRHGRPQVREAAPGEGRPARRKAGTRRVAGVRPQKAGATAKDLFLFELERARVAVLAAIQGIGAGTATRPMGEGRWSIHELVLHLAVRDRVRVEEFDSLLAGHAASWTNVSPGAEQAAENKAHLVPLRGCRGTKRCEC